MEITLTESEIEALEIALNTPEDVLEIQGLGGPDATSFDYTGYYAILNGIREKLGLEPAANIEFQSHLGRGDD